jgi:hypothetical protein
MTENVTQADREAARALMDRWEFGDLHCDDFVEAFARHGAARLAEGVALGIEAAARYVQDNYPHDKRTLVPALRNLAPAAIIAAHLAPPSPVV